MKELGLKEKILDIKKTKPKKPLPKRNQSTEQISISDVNVINLSEDEYDFLPNSKNAKKILGLKEDSSTLAFTRRNNIQQEYFNIENAREY